MSEQAKQSKGMVDVSGKEVTRRTAIATAELKMGERAYRALINDESPKGNVLETARVAGVMAAKATPQIIPLCHPLPIGKVQVSFELDDQKFMVTASAEVMCEGKTGVEMEALHAASTACLTIYDMMKWCGHAMEISSVKLLHKSGGKSGTFQRKSA